MILSLIMFVKRTYFLNLLVLIFTKMSFCDLFCSISIMLLRFIWLWVTTCSYQIERSNCHFRLVAWNQPRWGYLHHGNHQSLHIRAFFFKETVVNIYQHTTGFIHLTCVIEMYCFLHCNSSTMYPFSCPGIVHISW